MEEDEETSASVINENRVIEWRTEKRGFLSLCNENDSPFPGDHNGSDQNYRDVDDLSYSSDSTLSGDLSDEYTTHNPFDIHYDNNATVYSSTWFQQLQCFSNFFQSISDVLNMDTKFYSSITYPTNTQTRSYEVFHRENNNQHLIGNNVEDNSIEDKESSIDEDEGISQVSVDIQNDVSEEEGEVTISFIEPKSLEESLIEEKAKIEKAKIIKQKKKDRATLLKEWKEQKKKEKVQKGHVQDMHKTPSKKTKPRYPSSSTRKIQPKTPQRRKNSDTINTPTTDKVSTTKTAATINHDDENIYIEAPPQTRMSVPPKPRKMKRYSSTQKRNKKKSSQKQPCQDSMSQQGQKSPSSFYAHPSSLFFSLLAKTIGTHEDTDKNKSNEVHQQNSTPTEREAASLTLAKHLKSQNTELNETLISTKRDLNITCTQNYQLQVQLREGQEELLKLQKQHCKTLTLVKEQTAIVAHSNAIQLEMANLKKLESSLRQQMKLQYDSEIRKLKFQARLMKLKLIGRKNNDNSNDESNDDKKISESNEIADTKISSDVNSNIVETDDIMEEMDNLVFAQIDTNSSNIEAQTQLLMTKSKDPYVLTALLEEREENIVELRSQLLAAEQLRRSMHNHIQELRGNIRVYVRVRPFLSIMDNTDDEKHNSQECLFQNSNTISLNDKHVVASSKKQTDQPVFDEGTATTSMKLVEEEEYATPIEITNTSSDDSNYPTVISIAIKQRKKYSDNKASLDSTKHDFNFDRVFGPSALQEEIFDEVTDFVQSAMDGYNVCLFSYGQTGSGKTHTMEGFGTGHMRGIIPRAVEQILVQANICQKTNDSIIPLENDTNGLKKDHTTTSSSVTSKNSTWEYELHASFLEIYNESLRDLLLDYKVDDGSNIDDVASTTNKDETNLDSEDCSNKHDNGMVSEDSEKGRKKNSYATSSRGTMKADRKLVIRKIENVGSGGRRSTYVKGLSRVQINVKSISHGMEQLNSIIETASNTRSVASTKMNSQSSRSHSIFILDIKGIDKETGTTVSGSLNLCDLAGSERLSRTLHNNSNDSETFLSTKSPLKTNNKNDPNKTLLKETQSINKSLSALGDVFSALATNASHVPYRNTKLTYLLQDCLSGNGKSMMFVNLSPTVESCDESLCSLRFARRVSQVELGKAVKHRQTKKKTLS